MVADIGTRKGASLADISTDSPWKCGFDWMMEDKLYFPVKSVNEKGGVSSTRIPGQIRLL